MIVRVLTPTAGPGFSYAAGEEADVDDSTALAWCNNGQAEPVVPVVVEPRRRRPAGERAVVPPGGELA